ncbi:MAG: hypothetical protein ACK52V_12650 [Betaproteobacteria bacterium]|jgi:hypothetical protein
MSAPTAFSKLGIVLRHARASDLAFILATWKRRMRNVGDRALMTNRVYFDYEGKRIEGILARPEASVAILCQDPDSEHLLGYVVHQMHGPVFVLHFAHIKGVYQRMGLLTQALRLIYPPFLDEEIATTHVTPELAPKLNRYRIKYNPYL